VEEGHKAVPILGELTHTENFVAMTFPKLGYRMHGSQVADGQGLLADHEHHGRSSSCAASFRGRNGRIGNCTHSGIGLSHGSNSGCRALRNVQENPMKADL